MSTPLAIFHYISPGRVTAIVILIDWLRTRVQEIIGAPPIIRNYRGLNFQYQNLLSTGEKIKSREDLSHPMKSTSQVQALVIFFVFLILCTVEAFSPERLFKFSVGVRFQFF